MIKKALEYLVSLSKANTLVFDAIDYTDKQIFKIPTPKIETLEIKSLKGVVQYAKEISQYDITYITLDVTQPIIIRIVDYNFITVETTVINTNLARQRLLETLAEKNDFQFGNFYDAERFNILLQSVFADTADKETILKVIGNLKETSVKNIGDDGVSQSVTAKVGIATVAEVKVPNPVILKPYRTFTEIEQPESKFIFRMRNGGECALFLADGGMWKQEAKQNIYKYLENELVELINAKQVILLQ